jgi:hypothetical protein
MVTSLDYGLQWWICLVNGTDSTKPVEEAE